jgi:transcriptional regulator with XRE-family HTH domain
LYASHNFRLEWDNDISFHVAENAIHLRRRRGKSQADIAKIMGTSQPAIARIEGGDENITLGTLKRLVSALEGRIRFAIEPQELSLPRWPEWTSIGTALGAPSGWAFRAAEERRTEGERQLAGGWSTTELTTTALREGFTSLEEAS